MIIVLLVCTVSSPLCSQLFQANHSVFGSSQGSSTEDLFTDSIDSCDLDITEKVQTLFPYCTLHDIDQHLLNTIMQFLYSILNKRRV